MATTVGSHAAPFLLAEVRHVPALQSLKWLRRGWDDLWHVNGASLTYGGLIATTGAVLLMLGSSHLYLLVAAVSAYLLVGPVMATGLHELSRRRERGEAPGFDESLDALSRNPRSLFLFSMLLAGFVLLWFAASEVMLRSVWQHPGPDFAKLLWGSFFELGTRGQLLPYVASGALLAAIVFCLSAVAIPLIIDRNASATEAMWLSVKATARNLPAMLLWSALIVVLTAIGFVTLLVGMIVIAPLLGHASWHAYRDLIA
ncbi:MAG TPA: DUF2189 domain-containing protein [Steroidobacteraceae bacterium]|nr:DUF2189 domain-containing protein [Steroidobacteraceae bacterium]